MVHALRVTACLLYSWIIGHAVPMVKSLGLALQTVKILSKAVNWMLLVNEYVNLYRKSRNMRCVNTFLPSLSHKPNRSGEFFKVRRVSIIEKIHDLLNTFVGDASWRFLFVCLLKRVHVCGRGLTDESEIIKFLQHGTLVGLLPVPHPILIRKYQVHLNKTVWTLLLPFTESFVESTLCVQARIPYLLIVLFNEKRMFFFNLAHVFFFCCRPTVALKCGSEPTCGELSTSGKI